MYTASFYVVIWSSHYGMLFQFLFVGCMKKHWLWSTLLNRSRFCMTDKMLTITKIKRNIPPGRKYLKYYKISHVSVKLHYLNFMESFCMISIDEVDFVVYTLKIHLLYTMRRQQQFATIFSDATLHGLVFNKQNLYLSINRINVIYGTLPYKKGMFHCLLLADHANSIWLILFAYRSQYMDNST